MSTPEFPLVPGAEESFFGLQPGWTERDLKRAYAALLKQWKPERFPEQFQRLRAAYESLQHTLRHRTETTPPADGAPTPSTPAADGPAAPRRTPAEIMEAQGESAALAELESRPPATTAEVVALAYLRGRASPAHRAVTGLKTLAEAFGKNLPGEFDAVFTDIGAAVQAVPDEDIDAALDALLPMLNHAPYFLLTAPLWHRAMDLDPKRALRRLDTRLHRVAGQALGDECRFLASFLVRHAPRLPAPWRRLQTGYVRQFEWARTLPMRDFGSPEVRVSPLPYEAPPLEFWLDFAEDSARVYETAAREGAWALTLRRWILAHAEGRTGDALAAWIDLRAGSFEEKPPWGDRSLPDAWCRLARYLAPRYAALSPGTPAPVGFVGRDWVGAVIAALFSESLLVGLAGLALGLAGAALVQRGHDEAAFAGFAGGLIAFAGLALRLLEFGAEFGRAPQGESAPLDWRPWRRFCRARLLNLSRTQATAGPLARAALALLLRMAKPALRDAVRHDPVRIWRELLAGRV